MEVCRTSMYLLLISHSFGCSALKAIEILEAYEGTLEDDYPPDNERCEHSEMVLYKVLQFIAVTCRFLLLVIFFRSSENYITNFMEVNSCMRKDIPGISKLTVCSAFFGVGKLLSRGLIHLSEM